MAVEAMNAGTRRFVFGANVALTILLALLVTAFLVWGAGRLGGRIDLSSSGQNSLKPRTVQLLKSLEKPVSVSGLYTTALKEIRPFAEKHRNRVRDLLDLYETAAPGKIKTRMLDPQTDPVEVKDLLKRLQEKSAYKGESQPHKDAVEGFGKLNEEIETAVTAELKEIDELVKEDQKLNRLPTLAGYARDLRTLTQKAIQTKEDLVKLREAEIPRWGSAVEMIRGYLTSTKAALVDAQMWMTGEAMTMVEVSDRARAFFQNSRSRHAPLTAKLDAEIEKTKDLKAVKLEELYDSLKSGESILIENEEEAVVVPGSEVWVYRSDPRAPAPPDNDPQDFAGEQAVSSAVLKLSQKEKTGVIFTRFGGEPLLRPDFQNIDLQRLQQLPRAPYGMVNQLLDKENFEAVEWDVATAPAAPPVEGAKRLVYIVFPPEQPPQINAGQPPRAPQITPQQKQSILDAVRSSGMAIFLAGWARPLSRMAMAPGSYEYNDYLKSDWGIDVKASYLTLHFARNPQKTEEIYVPASRQPTVLTTDVLRMSEHAIVKPLAALPAGMDEVAPLSLIPTASRPAGVIIDTLVEVPKTQDVWAFNNVERVQEDFQKRQGTRRYEDDIAAPFPVAVAASNEKGSKIVVFSAGMMFGDEMLQQASLVSAGGQMALAQAYPANSDLLVNALHWLTGDAGRIAVGVSSGDVPRLDRLKNDGTKSFCEVFLVGIWPAVALALGAIMWFLRRR